MEHIFASEILGCPLNANDMGYFNAFHEGLNTCLMPSFPPLIRVRLSNPTVTYAHLYASDSWRE